MGTIGSSFSAGVVTGTFSANSRWCTDLKGQQTWTVQVQMASASGLVNGSNPSYIIDPSKIKMYTANTTAVTGSCQVTQAAVGTPLTLSTSAQTLFNKTNYLGDVCHVVSSPTIVTTIDANKPVGTYTGMLTVTFPS